MVRFLDAEHDQRLDQLDRLADRAESAQKHGGAALNPGHRCAMVLTRLSIIRRSRGRRP